MFRFGHLSDIHFNYLEGYDYDTNTMRDRLLRKLDELDNLQAIFITGDLFYRGKTDAESVEKISRFIKDLTQVTGCEMKNVYICPGNHDLTRSVPRARVLKNAIADYNEKKRFSTNDYSAIIHNQFCYPFNTICESITGISDPQRVHRVFSLDDINLVVLNTAVFSGQVLPTDPEEMKKLDDTNLFICDEKFDDLKREIREKFAKNKPTIFLGHHSPDCFEEAEKVRLEEYLGEINCDLYMCGHIHKISTGWIQNTAATYMVTCGGPFRDETGYNDPSFVVGEYDPSSCKLTLQLYRYVRTWALHNQANLPWKEGIWSWTIERLKTTPVPEKESVSSSHKSSKQLLSPEETQKMYYRFIQSQTSSVVLRNAMPETGNTYKFFKLREIYTPLHFVKHRESSRNASSNSSDNQPLSSKLRHDISFLMSDNNPFRNVILGNPGCGKTTLIKWLATTMSSNEDTLIDSEASIRAKNLFPILLRCRDYADMTSRDEFFAIFTKRTHDSLRAQFLDLIKKHLEDGDALLLIDGLHEIENEQKRRLFIAELQRLLDKYTHTNVFVTSQPTDDIDFVSVFPDYKIWDIDEFSDSDITDFCGKWFRLMYGDNEVDRNLSFLASVTILGNSRLRNLVRNPLTLISQLTSEKVPSLYSNKRVDLYRKTIDSILKSSIFRSHKNLDLDELKYLLGYIAFTMTMGNKKDFAYRIGVSKTELMLIFKKARKDFTNLIFPNELIAFVSENDDEQGVIFGKSYEALCLDGSNVQQYSFTNIMYMEYFVAYAIACGYFPGASDDNRDGSILFPELLNPLAKSVIALTAAMDPRCSSNLIDEIIKQLVMPNRSVKEIDTLRELLLQMIEDEVPISRKALKESFDALFKAYLYKSDIPHLKAILTGRYAEDLRSYFEKVDNKRHVGYESWCTLLDVLEDKSASLSKYCSQLADAKDDKTRSRALCLIACYSWMNGKDSFDNLDAEEISIIRKKVIACIKGEDIPSIGCAFEVISYAGSKVIDDYSVIQGFFNSIAYFMSKTETIPSLVPFDELSLSYIANELLSINQKLSASTLRNVAKKLKERRPYSINTYKCHLLLLLIISFAFDEDSSFDVNVIFSTLLNTKSIGEQGPNTYLEGFVPLIKKLLTLESFANLPKKRIEVLQALHDKSQSLLSSDSF